MFLFKPTKLLFCLVFILGSTTDCQAIHYTLPKQVLCGQSHLYTPGRLKSPGYPNPYPNNLDCNWTISANGGKHIFIQFFNFSLEDNPRCAYDYLEVYDGDSVHSTRLGRYCGYQLPGNLTSSGSNLFIVFRSDKNVEYNGFSFTYSDTIDQCGQSHLYSPGTLKSPLYPNLYPNNVDCKWIVSSNNDKHILLQFSYFSLEGSSSCVFDYLEVYDGDSVNSTRLGRYCGEQLPENLRSSGSNFFIVFHTDGSDKRNGFVFNYTDTNDSCGHSHLNTPGALRSPQYPNLYPNNLDCKWTISSTDGKPILLQFSHFSLEGYAGCKYDYLDIYDGNSANARRLGRYCGDHLPGNLQSSGSNFFIVFHTDSSRRRSGFVFYYAEVSCGDSHLYTPGTLKSPGYPNLYPNDMDCEWTISSTHGKSIFLQFSKFSLESEYDFLNIYDGDSADARRLGRYDGDELPGNLQSSGSNIFITFHTDGSGRRSGFVFNYTEVAVSCGDSHLYTPGTLKSPGYPNLYPNSMDCEWTISSTHGKQILLQFSNFSLESRFDFLYIYDGDSADAKRLGRYDGDQLPGNLQSSGSNVFIVFHTDGSGRRSGFVFNYTEVPVSCGDSHLYTPGTLKSPGYPNLYPNNMDCEWTISSTNGKLILLHFSHFLLESGYDFLYIYDGDSADARRLGRYDGDQLPGNLESSGSNVFIVFQTDGSGQRSGFVFNYTEECGENHLYAPGTLKSPFYPNLYPNNVDCNWTISSGNERHVLLQFSFFSLEFDSTCLADYLEVYDGDSLNSTSLGRYCGSQVPRNLVSSGSKFLIVFHTDHSFREKGFVFSYTDTSGLCGDRISLLTPGIFKSPGYPYSYPDNLDCEWRIFSGNRKPILLHFLHFEMERSYDCAADYLAVYDVENFSAKRLGRYCGDQLPRNLTASGSYLSIVFHTNGRQGRSGFVFQYVETNGVCGAIQLYTPGTLESPGYPNLYPNYLNCEWTIYNADGISDILLHFVHFSLESCEYEYLEVYNDDLKGARRLMGRYCGDQLPKDLKSSSHLFIKFHTNGNWGRSGGFILNYTSTNYSCGETYLYTPGTLKSPDLYSRNVDCVWRIFNVYGTPIFLEFLHLSTKTSRCGYEYLDVYDGDSIKSAKLGRYYGGQFPMFLLSSGPSLSIVYHRDSIYKERCGFAFRYANVSDSCGKTHLQTPGTLKFDDSALMSLSLKMDCVWTIFSTAGSHILLQFSQFSLRSSDECNYEHLTVYDGHFFMRYCGDKLPGELVSSGLNLTIVFHTDNFWPGSEFVLKVSDANEKSKGGTKWYIFAITAGAGLLFGLFIACMLACYRRRRFNRILYHQLPNTMHELDDINLLQSDNEPESAAQDGNNYTYVDI
ncbi:cubilin-like isoform X2 [Dendronephthya gigantea]|uniref:cubilin-like isoform X2 n=1 Tax=Dendronephthya gigantea TaxID=151771 RepID=UPI00106BE0E1|nr:cubilin-like isoform X2 [Dendronephthya gigantea]